MKNYYYLLFLLVILLLANTNTYARNIISGTILNKQEEPIEFANITLLDTTTNRFITTFFQEPRSRSVTLSGSYNFANKGKASNRKNKVENETRSRL